LGGEGRDEELSPRTVLAESPPHRIVASDDPTSPTSGAR
jgi:hypothetical protein